MNTIYARTCVLGHDLSVLVVQIGQAERVLRHVVEELLFCFEVVFDSLVIIQVVARKIGEDAAGKLQTADTLLCDRVGADFHECVFASGVCHLTQQAVKGNRVGGWYARSARGRSSM
mgnify:CR=1 FL=1